MRKTLLQVTILGNALIAMIPAAVGRMLTSTILVILIADLAMLVMRLRTIIQGSALIVTLSVAGGVVGLIIPGKPIVSLAIHLMLLPITTLGSVQIAMTQSAVGQTIISATTALQIAYLATLVMLRPTIIPGSVRTVMIRVVGQMPTLTTAD
jgi:hypothetical protein